ncbi:MAG: hypothetical protein J0L54_14280 [Chitinophagales bacterium]|nr:hypothetical protein [Chitinophagales bacterium]
MENIDKLISVLFNARSDNREKMLSDLVLTVLYKANGGITISNIVSLIKELFHLEPIKYEVEKCLQILAESNQILVIGDTFKLSDNTIAQIYTNIVRSKDNRDKRFESFERNTLNILEENLGKEIIHKLWEFYNEYLLESFLLFGRKAIDIFLPYKKDILPQNDNLIEQFREKLGSDYLYAIFKRIIVEYPERMSEAELRHLNGLASRAEKFYSLGIEKHEYEKINELQIKNLIVIADTNVLYTDLNLHIHQEKSAISEIVRLAKDKIIDFRIVYLPRTYKELQKAKKPLENLISREKFKESQIRAMIASNNLDALAKQYYENLLRNSDFPHPADNITYASTILNQHGIQLYNYKFAKLEEDQEYFDKKVSEYYDYQRYYNNLYEAKGSSVRLVKDDFKIEHDVYLREVIKILKERFSKDFLKYICLTTDRSLIYFDQYLLRKEGQGMHEVINPNFMMPSLFIKKIRPFIPIITNNYRKAFISSLTAPTVHKESESEKERTILTQKSLTYFKNLGIDDEDVICSIIKKELFLEELSRHEEDNSVDEFIKSEISKEIQDLKHQRDSLENEITNQKKFTEEALLKEKSAKVQIAKEKDSILLEKKIEINDLINKIIEKESIEDHLQKLNQEQAKFTLEKTIELKKALLEEIDLSIMTLENSERPLLTIIDKKVNIHKWHLSIIPVLFFLINCYLIYRIGWDKMEPYTYLLSLGLTIISYLYLAILGHSLDPKQYFYQKKIAIENSIYTEFSFDKEHLIGQKKRKAELETELVELSFEEI